jgi:hypothetical protein
MSAELKRSSAPLLQRVAQALLFGLPAALLGVAVVAELRLLMLRLLLNRPLPMGDPSRLCLGLLVKRAVPMGDPSRLTRGLAELRMLMLRLLLNRPLPIGEPSRLCLGLLLVRLAGEEPSRLTLGLKSRILGVTGLPFVAGVQELTLSSGVVDRVLRPSGKPGFSSYTWGA